MKNRVLLPELMDDPNLDAHSLKAALNDISKVNNWLGGKKTTLKGLHYFFKNYKQERYTLVDVGCGDGEMLRAIALYCRQHQICVNLIGLDLNEKSLELARSYTAKFPEIIYKKQDILKLNDESIQYDIITSTLTMHHFTDDEVLKFMTHFKNTAKLGVVINDLHRSRVAYILFQVFSRIFMKTQLARYDGLISIKRAFTKAELQTLTRKMRIKNYTLNWQWAFRYLWIIDNKA